MLAVLGVFLMGLYLIYDTQLISGNKQNKFKIDDYVWASVCLYIDITQMFIYVLQIFGK